MYRLLALPAEALWLAGDAIKRAASAVDDLGELVGSAGYLANTGAGHIAAALERLRDG